MVEFLPHVVYVLCALTAMMCAVLLARAYLKSQSRLLLFSALCFTALALNSILLVVDRIVLPTEVDLRAWRIGVATVGLVVMLGALITSKDREG
ncbi:MAG TPA: DUF5985 family protein [Phycisphaerales bacterium]|nr:DUF5985 family protein [Phycisphaerales bacterium]